MMAACGPGTVEPPPPEDRAPQTTARQAPQQVPDGPADLRTCPHGDAAWGDAIRKATAEGTLDGLLGLCLDVMSENPERWEPGWAAAESLYRLGRVGEARKSAAASLLLAKELGDEVGIAANSYRLGWLAFKEGRLKTGDLHYREGLAAAQAAGRDDMMAQLLNGHAGLLIEIGRYREAHVQQGRAVEVMKRLGLDRYARMASLNQAVILLFLGDANSAESMLTGIYEDSRASRDTFMLPRAALTLGNLHRRMDRPEEAVKWYDRVSGEDAELVGLAKLNQGLIAIRKGDFENAGLQFDLAYEKVGPVDRILIDAYRADVDLESGSPGAALERLGGVLADAGRLGSVQVSWIGRWIAGRALMEQGKYVEAVESLRRAAEILDRQGSDLDPMQEGLRYLRECSDVYTDLAAALCGTPGSDLARDSGDEVLASLEKTHARALRHLFSMQGGGERQVAGIEAIRTGLADGELLLDYAVGRERGIVLAITPDRFVARTIPGWEELSEPLRRYRSALQRPLRSAEARLDPMADLKRSVHHGMFLVDALLGPVRELIGDATRIYIIPDRNLALMPFDALPVVVPEDDGGVERIIFLGERVETAVMPLAGKPASRSVPGPPLLLAGDPVPDEGGAVPRLTHAGREIDLIEKIWGDESCTVLRGESLLAAPVRERIVPELGTLHFATHAVASTSDSDKCAVFLSRGEKLGLEDIAGLHLDSSLVVLSACRTGEGELVPGEGVIGLGWAFLLAGADTVGVSLWSVDDRSATELMAAFHTGLRDGKDPVAAMASARRAIAAGHPHPAFWAPFVVVARPGE